MAEIKCLASSRWLRRNDVAQRTPPPAQDRKGAYYVAKQVATQVRFSRDVGRGHHDGRWLEGTRKQAYVRTHRDITTHGQIIVASPEEGGTLSSFLAICGPVFGVPML